MSEIENCPHCLGVGEEYNSRTKRGINCHMCKGSGTVDEIVNYAYLNEMIPSINMDI